jgi:hypothetical protein
MMALKEIKCYVRFYNRCNSKTAKERYTYKDRLLHKKELKKCAKDYLSWEEYKEFLRRVK